MIEFGKTLKSAREAKGLTISQIAGNTRILPAIIEGLENEDFSKIVAPIYGRGFIKLYCEAVGLELKPMIDEFMAIYTGAREPTIHTREPAKIVVASSPSEVSSPHSAPITPPSTNDFVGGFQFSQKHIRIALIIVAALFVLAIVSCGIRALYRATNPPHQAEAKTEIVETTAQPSATPRTTRAIEPLYMD